MLFLFAFVSPTTTEQHEAEFMAMMGFESYFFKQIQHIICNVRPTLKCILVIKSVEIILVLTHREQHEPFN